VPGKGGRCRMTINSAASVFEHIARWARIFRPLRVWVRLSRPMAWPTIWAAERSALT